MVKGVFVRRYALGECWICGFAGKRSREHKIKASDIRRHFGGEAMYVDFTDDIGSNMRIAQGPSSSHLKYKSMVCEDCNSSVTQDSDRAYDEFIQAIERKSSDENAIRPVISDQKFRLGSKLHVPLFRYFAKRLGCHLADLNAPIPTYLSRFVACKTNTNRIRLGVRLDPTYPDYASRLFDSNLQYAAHGGLIIVSKGPKLLPSRIHSTMTIGPIQHVFEYDLAELEVLEIRFRHPDFTMWCAEAARLAIENPISQSKLDQLGF